MVQRNTGIIACILLLFLTACKEKPQKTAPSPPEVDISLPLKHRIIEWEEYTGRFEAVNHVDIRSRVSGYLVEKTFTDGQIVAKGDVLFVIDPRPFEYELQRATAHFQLAQKEYKRAKRLRETQAIAQEDLDRREQELKVAKAVLSTASLNMEFTRVTAPISGRVSESHIDLGNLIRENETILTRVVSINPVHFVFEGSQTQLLKYLRTDPSGLHQSPAGAAYPALIKLQDEYVFSHKGRIDFADNIVDPQTGSIRLRALIENKDGILYPGLFGRARVTQNGEYEALLLPENAINTDQNKKFVYIVDNENKAQRKYIRTGSLLENGYVVIQQGLEGTEKVVIKGIQRIRRPAQPVTPSHIDLKWVKLNNVPDLNTIPSLEEIAGKPAIEQVRSEQAGILSR